MLFRLGGLPRWFPVGTVKFFGEPHSVGMSNCLVGVM